MDLLNPIVFSNSMLTSTTAAETVTLWSSLTSYVVGNQARLGSPHYKIYECLIDNSNASPDVNLTGDTPKWLEVGADNAHLAFDSKWGTQTTALYSLQFVLTPGVALDSLALLNLLGSNVNIHCTVGGITKYDRDISLQSDIGVYDWRTYFVAPIVAQDDVVVSDLLPYNTQIITITITGPGTVACGNISMGSTVTLGNLLYGVKVGIIDYSKKDTDAQGNFILVERAYSKRFSGTIDVPNTFVDQLAALLASVRATPLVWIGLGTTYSSLIVWGFIADFEVDIVYETHSHCSFSIKGLT